MSDEGRQTCFITGGAGGIGRACATLAAARGYAVALTVLPSELELGSAIVRELEEFGAIGMTVPCDVSVQDEVVGAYDLVERQLGSPSAVVNAAGLALAAPVYDLDAAHLEQLMRVNVVGLMISCREAVRRMAQSRGGDGGAIVNFSSMAATIGGRPGAAAYAASKAAVDVFTKGIAKEVAREGIRVNSVRPGTIATAMTQKVQDDPALLDMVSASIPMGRIGRPEEVATAVLWLLSDEASFVTGSHVEVGGGGFATSASI